MTTETGSQTDPQAARGAEQTPLHVLSDIAPSLVPVLYELADKTWPGTRETARKRFGAFGPTERVREELPVQYRVLLRRYDLGTLDPCWRLEAGGPVEVFDWDDSGRITGPYGFRYPVYSVAPVYDEVGRLAGFGLNGRPSTRDDGALASIDARMECASFVRSTDAGAVSAALRALAGRPRTEETRPGMAPTHAYFDVLQRVDKRLYLANRGVNQYVSPGWTPETIRAAFDDPAVRALWIADPDGPSATPEPQEH
jgi:hypothetical protein